MSQPILVRSLSDREARLLSALAAAGRNIFTIEEARQTSGADGADVARLLYRLAAKRWVQRLERGKYRLIPLEAGPEAHWAEHEYLVAAALVQPYYLGYATALNYYGYSERQPRPVWIVTTRRKRPVTIEGLTYRFVTLSEHKFFGYTTIQLLDSPVRIAEREKAIVDGFDHPEDRNYAPLDPRGPHEGVRDARWRLIVNIPERQLLEWREH